jgi:hypothetical protein
MAIGTQMHRRMTRGSCELPKVSPGSAMPDPSTPCEWPAAVFYPFGHPMPYAHALMPHRKEVLKESVGAWAPKGL